MGNTLAKKKRFNVLDTCQAEGCTQFTTHVCPVCCVTCCAAHTNHAPCHADAGGFPDVREPIEVGMRVLVDGCDTGDYSEAGGKCALADEQTCMSGEVGWAVTICTRQWKPIQNARGETMHAFIPLGEVHPWISYRHALKRARRKARIFRAAEGRQERVNMTTLDRFLVPAYNVLRDPHTQTCGDWIRGYRALAFPNKVPLDATTSTSMRLFARRFHMCNVRKRQRVLASFKRYGGVIHADGSISV